VAIRGIGIRETFSCSPLPTGGLRSNYHSEGGKNTGPKKLLTSTQSRSSGLAHVTVLKRSSRPGRKSPVDHESDGRRNRDIPVRSNLGEKRSMGMSRFSGGIEVDDYLVRVVKNH